MYLLLKSELAGIAKVAVCEPVQESKTGEPIKPLRDGWSTHNFHFLIKAKHRQPNANDLDTRSPVSELPEHARHQIAPPIYSTTV